MQTKRGLIESGAVDPEFFGVRPQEEQRRPADQSSSTALEDKARALGKSVDEVRQEQAAKFRQFMQRRNGYAKGGAVRPQMNLGALQQLMQLLQNQGQQQPQGGALTQMRNIKL